MSHRTHTTREAIGLPAHLLVTHTNPDPWGPPGSTVEVTDAITSASIRDDAGRVCGCGRRVCPECNRYGTARGR